MLLITTSRNPTKEIRSFTKDLHHSLPRSFRLTRGKISLKDLRGLMKGMDCRKALIATRWRGTFGKLEMMEIEGDQLRKNPPGIYLKGIKLRREFDIKGNYVASAITIGEGAQENIKLANSNNDIPIL